MINYNTPASKYTGKLQGDYKGELPQATSEYTELIASIIDGSEMKYPSNEFMKSIYVLYGGHADLQHPESRLTQLIQYGVYSDRYKVTSVFDEEIIVSDSKTGLTETVHIDDNLEKIWAKIIAGYKTHDGYSYYITTDGFIYCTNNGNPYLVKE